MAPGIDVNPALTTQLAYSFAVDYSELKSELVSHFVSPLQLQRRRANDQNRANSVAENHLLHNKARLDSFAKPHVICNQQVYPRHGQGTHHWVQLVFVNLYAAPEGRVQRAIVALRNGAPPYRIQERLETLGIVKASGLR